jgi:hypothetical protein
MIAGCCMVADAADAADGADGADAVADAASADTVAERVDVERDADELHSVLPDHRCGGSEPGCARELMWLMELSVACEGLLGPLENLCSRSSCNDCVRCSKLHTKRKACRRLTKQSRLP